MKNIKLPVKDPVTGLPHTYSILPQLEKFLVEDNALGALAVYIHGLDTLEQNHGPKVFDEIMKNSAKILDEMRGSVIREHDVACVSEIGGSTFLIFLSEKRKDRNNQSLQREHVESVADRVQEHVFPHLISLLYQYTKRQPRLSVGYSFKVHNPLLRPKRMIFRLIDEAKEMARLQRSRNEIKTKERLQRIILQEKITTVFQPIIELGTGKVVGYEALTRGPEGTVFEAPLMLFSLAREAGLVFELDRLCRKKALANAKKLPGTCKIFINTLPTTIHDPEFRGRFLQDFLRDIEKKPSNIVFEINERIAIENFAMFRKAMSYYTDIGMAIAIDDAGTGYSSLEAIVELEPRYLKFDLSMVSGIAKSSLKQEMLKMLCALAKRINAEIIAEGVENIKDLNVLKKMKVKYGQGYYFDRPMKVEELLSPKKFRKRVRSKKNKKKTRKARS